MPFDPDNPPAKLKNLSDKKKRQWVHVFNSCYSKTPDDKKCHQMAWGTVKKSAGELKDIVDSIPEKVALIEEMLGVRWNDAEEKFDVLSYPDIPNSEVDSVDNAPGGLTASRDWSEMVEKMEKRRNPANISVDKRIVDEITNAKRDIEAALKWRPGKEKKIVRITRASRKR